MINPEARKRVEVVSDLDPLSLSAAGKASPVSLGAACRAGTAAPQQKASAPRSAFAATLTAPRHSVSFALPAPGPERMANRKQPTWTYCGHLIDLPVTFANSGRKTRYSYNARVCATLARSRDLGSLLDSYHKRARFLRPLERFSPTMKTPFKLNVEGRNLIWGFGSLTLTLIGRTPDPRYASVPLLGRKIKGLPAGPAVGVGLRPQLMPQCAAAKTASPQTCPLSTWPH
jgi:hypothetical protein